MGPSGLRIGSLSSQTTYLYLAMKQYLTVHQIYFSVKIHEGWLPGVAARTRPSNIARSRPHERYQHRLLDN